jgi:hypothetical protein
MKRREFIEKSAVVTALLAVGVDALADDASNYTERISSVLISQDEKKLVVVTRNYHYIFPAQPTLVKTLKGSFHPHVSGRFADFRVSPYGVTSGKVTLVVAGAPRDELAEAIAAGFRPSTDGATFTTTVIGQRYRAGPIQLPEKYDLNSTYDISVASEQAGSKAPITPLRVVAGVLVIAGVALFALVIFGACAVHGTLGSSSCHE